MIHPQGFSASPAFQVGAAHGVIDTRALFYDGNSQGGIMGGALTAVAPDFTRAVLGVPGMNYSTLLRAQRRLRRRTRTILVPDLPERARAAADPRR